MNDTPAPHTIAYSTSGIYGHVMWVESINANGTINLTEYNNSASSKSHLLATSAPATTSTLLSTATSTSTNASGNPYIAQTKVL